MHLACKVGNIPILAYLFYHGAMINCRNKEGKFPDVVAADNNQTALADYFHKITAAPQPIEQIRFSEEDSVFSAEWDLPSQPNFFPRIDAVEIQVKQNKFFDSWKTIATFKSSMKAKEESDEPELKARMDFDKIEFDPSWSVPALDAVSSALLEEKKDKFEQRALPAKVYVAPVCSMVLDELVSGQQYVFRARCASKYGWGPYSNGVPIEVEKGKDEEKETSEEEKKEESETSEEEEEKNEEKKEESEKEEEESEKEKEERKEKKEESEEEKEEKKEENEEEEEEEEEERKKGKHRHRRRKHTKRDDGEQMNELLNGGCSALSNAVAEGIKLAELRDNTGNSLLHLAALNGQDEEVKVLVNQIEMDVNMQGDQKRTPLHMAVTGEHLNTIELLLSLGADISADDIVGN